MSATIIDLTARRGWYAEHPSEMLLSRKQLEQRIPYGQSSITKFIAAGMPVARRARVRGEKNLFRLSEVEAWLGARNSEKGDR